MTRNSFYHIVLSLLCATQWACVSDDQYTLDDFRDLTGSDTLRIAIAYDGTTAAVQGDAYGYVSTQGAHVTVNSTTNKFLLLTLSGSSSDGSLLVFSQKKWGAVLSNLSLHNPLGPAINNQCGKSFYVVLPQGTSSTLSDGAAYGQAPLNAAGEAVSQKGTLFSEGQIYFEGQGSLSVLGHAKNGIASDDYLSFQHGGAISVTMAATATNGLKANDGVFISSGTLSVTTAAPGSRGIKNDARMEMSGGSVSIATTGDCLIETLADGTADTTSCAAIKCDSLLLLSGGTLTVSSEGDGGKGINCSQQFRQTGGTLVATTTGSNSTSKPKAVKASEGIVLSGGTFRATTRHSWACDNGTGSEEPAQRVTLIGTPGEATFAKHAVAVSYE